MGALHYMRSGPGLHLLYRRAAKAKLSVEQTVRRPLSPSRPTGASATRLEHEDTRHSAESDEPVSSEEAEEEPTQTCRTPTSCTAATCFSFLHKTMPANPRAFRGSLSSVPSSSLPNTGPFFERDGRTLPSISHKWLLYKGSRFKEESRLST